MTNLKLLITCSRGLVTVLNNEIKRLGYNIDKSFDTGTYITADSTAIMQLNLRSRVANAVYIQIASGEIQHFDDLYKLAQKAARSQHLYQDSQLSVEVIGNHETLTAQRSIQSITHKSILDALQTSSPSPHGPTAEHILCHLDGYHATILLNTSGEKLYKRWRRFETGLAPLKENIAAGLVLLSGWKYKTPLVDRCCWSGTILIEAAMIAKNIAPWLLRTFAFQYHKNYDATVREQLINQAKSKQYDQTYRLIGFDINPKMVSIAQAHIDQLQLQDDIQVYTADANDRNLSLEVLPRPYHLLTNPPYDQRMQDDRVEQLHLSLLRRLYHEDVTSGGIYTAFPLRDDEITDLHTKRISNWDLDASLYWKW